MIPSAHEQIHHDSGLLQGQVRVERSGRVSRTEETSPKSVSFGGMRSELWRKDGEASGKRVEDTEAKERDNVRWKSRRGSGYHVREASARPSNTTVQGHTTNDRSG